jgi:type IV pilus assembly protein PilQ
VLSLKVTPQITPDNRVILDLTVAKGQCRPTRRERDGRLRAEYRHARDRHAGAGERRPDGGARRHPRDGAPRRRAKVPWLGDIPVLGYLFKTTSKTDNKEELLIFVTPRILREGASLY